MIQFDSKPSHYVSGISAPMSIASGVEEAVRTDLQTIPEVHGVNIEFDGDGYVVDILVRAPDKQLRYKIYDKQASIIQAFPGRDFDFRLAEAS